MAAPIGSLRREFLHQAIQDRVKQYIIDRGYQPGNVLPAEADLARELGISRPSLREAIRALQTIGVVESRHGTGTFVGRFSLIPLVDGLAFSIRVTNEEGTGQAIRELLQIREILEREMVVEVASALTPEHLDVLTELVDEMERHAALGEEFTDADRAFHRALYQPAGNPLVVQLIQAFWDVFFLLREDLPGMSTELEMTAANHRQIVDALRRGDGAAASAAMMEHFSGIRHRLKQTRTSTTETIAPREP